MGLWGLLKKARQLKSKKYIIESIIIAIVLTILSYGIGLHMGWIKTIDWLEVFAVFTSYSCTWLCTRQSRWNYPIGVITTAAYSLLFYKTGAIALAIFNLYLVYSLSYGWIRWGKDNATRPVTHIKALWYIGYAVFGLVILGVFLGANIIFNPNKLIGISPIDIGLAVTSGVAQLMLDNKKIENWIFWAMINIVSIPYFIKIGLTLVAFQYAFFLINTVVGYISWNKTMNLGKTNG